MEPVSGEEVSLKGSGTFAPSAALAAAVAASRHGAGAVRVKFPGLAAGTILVRAHKGKHSTPDELQAIEIQHAALNPLRTVGVTPMLAVRITADEVTGFVTVAVGTGKPLPGRRAIVSDLERRAPALGLLGISKLAPKNVVNELKGGAVTLKTDLGLTVGGYLTGSGELALQDDTVTFDAHAAAQVRPAGEMKLDLKRSPDGALSGGGGLDVNLGKLSGRVVVTYAQGVVEAIGKLAYRTEKLSGEVTLLVTDRETARTVAYEHLPPEAIAESAKQTAGASAAAKGPAPAGPKPGPRAIAGWGTLDVHFTEWLTGQATVIVDGEGHVTVIGKLTPPATVSFDRTKVDLRKRIFTFEVRAGYGIPVVGEIFVFFSLSLDAVAKVTPLTLSKIVVIGTYSTDPKIFNNFTISANLNLSAMAALELEAKAGAGLEILDHDIKIGAGLTAAAGLKAYLDATPVIGYRELGDPTLGKRGEFFVHGDVEIAGQPFLALAGFLFVAIETPWWSPLSDREWRWPLGELVYALPGEFGFGAEVDYVFGSGNPPAISTKSVDFSAEKFAGDLMDEKVPKGSHGQDEKKGAWKEKQAAPPAPPPAPPKVIGKGKPASRPDRAPAKDDATALKDANQAIDALRKRADASPMTGAEVASQLEAVKRSNRLTELRTKPSSGAVEVTPARGKLAPKRPSKIKVAPDKTPVHGQSARPAPTPAGSAGDVALPAPVSFTAGGEAHRVYVTIDGGSLHVMVASTPVDEQGYIAALRARINSLTGPAAAQRPALLARLAEQDAIAQSASSELIHALGTRAAPRERSPATLQRAITRLAERLRIVTEIASQTAATGTRDHPIPIVWHKRLGIYPSFEYRDPLTNERVRAFAEDTEVWLATPASRAGLGSVRHGDRINLAIESRFRPEVILRDSRHEPFQRLGAGIGDIARATRNVEYYREILVFNEVHLGSLQIDHIHEIGLQGPDVIGNLWPLGPAANRAANATYQQRVLVRRGSGPPTLERVEDLAGLYFYVSELGT
jgi:hypothetical protein